MQEYIFQAVFIAPYCFLEQRTSNFSKQPCQLFFAMARMAALWICEDISIGILSLPHWTFTCFLGNSHKSTQARCKVCSNLTSVLQQLTFVLLAFCFINLERLSHPTLVLLFTLWKRTFCQNNAVMLTYTHNHAPKILLWKCSYHRNEKQNSKFFFNYDAN